MRRTRVSPSFIARSAPREEADIVEVELEVDVRALVRATIHRLTESARAHDATRIQARVRELLRADDARAEA